MQRVTSVSRVTVLKNATGYLKSVTGKKHCLTVSCPSTTEPRKKLHLKLALYNYPEDEFPLNKANLIGQSLSNRLWRKCFTDFLTEIDF